jgi:hypothetical protein
MTMSKSADRKVHGQLTNQDSAPRGQTGQGSAPRGQTGELARQDRPPSGQAGALTVA